MSMTISFTRPLIKAAQIKANLTYLDHLGEDAKRKVLAALRPETVRQIEDSTRVDWLPLELDIELTDTVVKVVGDKGMSDWALTCLMVSSQSGLLGPLVTGSIRLFGLSPKAVFKIAPKAWLAVFKNCGHLVIEDKAKTTIELVGHNLPQQMIESNAYLVGIQGSFRAVFELTRFKGNITIDRRSIERRQVVWTASW